MAQAQTISGKSTGEIDFSAGIKDVAAAMSDASGGITTPFNNATQDDTDAQIIVEDVVNVEQAKTIAEASSGAIDFRLGIEDAAGDLANIGGTIDASLTAATAVTGDSDTTIKITTSANVAQASTIAQSTTGQVDFDAGIEDDIGNMSNAGGTAALTAFSNATATGSTNGDDDVNVTVNDAVTVAQGTIVAGATSGTLQFTTGISGLVATMANAEGTVEADFETVADRDTDIQVVVTDTLNVAQAATIAGETTGQVDFSDVAGITDSAAAMASDSYGSRWHDAAGTITAAFGTAATAGAGTDKGDGAT